MTLYQKIQKIFSTKPNEKQLDSVKKVLDKCCDIYYNTDQTPPLTDEEFDFTLLNYKKYREYTTLTKSTAKRLVNVGHIFPDLVGTTTKVNSVYESEKPSKDHYSLEEWIDDLGVDELFRFGVTFGISDKYDGNSVCFEFDGDTGELISALTRGKDGEGADVTNLFTHIKYPYLQPKMKIGMKTEIMVTDEHKAILEEKMGREYAKNRSIVSAVLSREDGHKFSKYLDIVPLAVQYRNDKIKYQNPPRSQQMFILKQLNGKFGDIDFNMSTVQVKSKEEALKGIKEIYNQYISNRDKLNYPIDGVVIEIVNQDLRDRLGRSGDTNNYDTALKFPYNEKKSKVKDIKFYTGTTGRITPVVVFEDIVFDGAVCNHVSVANYKRFKELNLAKGDSVIIEYRNEVLSYLQPDPSGKTNNPPIKFISKCPSCGEKLYVNKTKTFVNCKNEQCPAILKGRFVNWFEKLNIKGIKESTIERLINVGVITDIPDLYTLTKEDILKAEGLKDKSAQNILDAINSKTELYDWELLGSLGIESFSSSKAKELAKVYTLKDLFKMKPEQMIASITSVEGFAEITAKYILNGIIKNKEVIKRLYKLLNVKMYKDVLEANKNNSGETYTIVFTGIRDKELQNKLEERGHKVTGSVSNNTDIVVCKDPNGSSSKIKKAKELGKEILTIEGIKAKLNI